MRMGNFESKIGPARTCLDMFSGPYTQNDSVGKQQRYGADAD